MHLKVEFSENVCLKEEYLDFDSCQSIIDRLEKIRRKFLNLKSKANELPSFYSVDLSKLSPNELQSKKYLQEKFTYYLTEYRKKKLEEMKQIPFFRFKRYLTGIQDSGKSFFLSDFVLRQRFLCKESKYRILYINNSAKFIKSQVRYIMNELIYTFCFDTEDKGELKDMKYPPIIEKNIDTKNQIVHWLYYLQKNFEIGNYRPLYDFFKEVKQYYQSNNIEFILIWDQINVLYRKKSDFQTILNQFCNPWFFDWVLLSASNNNKETIEVSKEDYEIKMDSSKTFNESELKHLIRLDAENYHPFDTIDMEQYVKDVFKLTEGSLSEYHHYKSAWNWKEFKCKISYGSFNNIKTKYKDEREGFVIKTETKFRKKNIEDEQDLFEYFACLRKAITLNDYRAIIDDEKKV